MAPYWISLLLAVGFMLLAQRPLNSVAAISRSAISARDGRVYSRWGVVASALVFIILTGFRYGVGQDYFYTYVPYFYRVRSGLGFQEMEIGYYALNYLVARFTDNPLPVFLVCSVAFFALTYAAIMRESSHPVFSVFLLFGMSYLFIYMNAMRQMLAVSILLFSLRYIEERDPVKFAACVAIASTFHSSSLVFIAAYYFPRLKITPFICLVLVSGFLLLKVPIASFVNTIIAKTQYAGYIGSIFDTGESGNVVIALNVVVLLFSAIVPKLYGGAYSERYRILLWCQLVATSIAILSGLIPLSQRLRWVFSLPSVILLPLAIDSISNIKLKFLIQLVIVVLYIVYIAITIGMWNGNNVVPYHSILMKGSL